MNELSTIDQKINDFIYDKPDVAVVLLQQFGYNISLRTATLPQIAKLVYTALYINKDVPFSEALSKAISSDGELNFVVALATATISSLIGGFVASSEGKKNRAVQKKLALTQLSMDEKLSEEKIRADQETARMTILANTMLSYRETLVKESTARLKDTWLYVTGLGIGLGIIYGVYLIGSKD